MTSDLDSNRSHGDRVRSRAYLREFFAALAAYYVILPLVIVFGGLDGPSPLRFGWAVLPMLPALGMVWAVWRHLQRVDEFQRMLLLQSLSIGFGVMLMVIVTLGFLAMAGLAVSGGTLWGVFGAGMAAWGVAAIVLTRRGRA